MTLAMCFQDIEYMYIKVITYLNTALMINIIKNKLQPPGRAAASKSLQSCPILCDPMDSSLPGFSVHGILQARTLEWVARRAAEYK